MEPTIQMLIDAVAHPMGGGNEQLAIKMTGESHSLEYPNAIAYNDDLFVCFFLSKASFS